MVNFPSKLIAYRDDGWLPKRTDFRQWDHLTRAFGVNLQMIDDWSEAEVPKDHTTVLVIEEGAQSLDAFKHPKSATYVFGKSAMTLTPRHVPCDVTLRIDTPQPISLFGVEAAAIILADRQRKLTDDQ